jgi:hypothetical protein
MDVELIIQEIPTEELDSLIGDFKRSAYLT